MTYLAGLILVGVKVSFILICCVRPAPANKRCWRPGRGRVDKLWETKVTTLNCSAGGGEVADFPVSTFQDLKQANQIGVAWVTDDLPSQFTRPQELARNTYSLKYFLVKINRVEVVPIDGPSFKLLPTRISYKSVNPVLWDA